MFIEKFEVFLALFAGLVLLVTGILINFSLPDILLRLLIVLVVFYIIGSIIKSYLRKKIFIKIEAKEELDEENANETKVSLETTETESNAEN